MTRRPMARRETPLAWLPNDRYVHDADLDYRLSERARVSAGLALAALLMVGLILAPLAIGGLLLRVLGL